MKKIPLTQGKFALVDDEDFEHLNQWKWYAVKSHATYYASRSCYGKTPAVVRMHRELIDTENIDHKNGNGLDNRRSNLRPCTHSENRQNMTKTTRKLTSTYKGVSWDKSRNKWEAKIHPPGCKQIRIGRFDCEIEAAKAYDKSAIAVFGEFANTNF